MHGYEDSKSAGNVTETLRELPLKTSQLVYLEKTGKGCDIWAIT